VDPSRKIPINALEFDERRARYAFLSPFIEGAHAIELLDPTAALEPGARFLKALGAAEANSLFSAPNDERPLPDLTTVDGAGARALLIVHDGHAWLSAQERFDALLHSLQAMSNEARVVLVFRNPTGTALASLNGQATRSPAPRFVFGAIEEMLAARFASVRFATQSAMWGCQIAPLMAGEELEIAVDGRLDKHSSAAFFIALCARTPLDFPQEMTLVPLPTQPLARSAARFEKLSGDLRRAEAALRQQRERDDLERRLDELRQALEAAEARAERTEHLIDELTTERASLLDRIDAADRARAESEQRWREREAQLGLTKVAMAQLQARVQALDALVLDQDARLDRSGALDEALDRKLELSRAECLQREGRIGELEAAALERAIRFDTLVDELSALDTAIDALARQRSGKAIQALIDLHTQLRADRPCERLDALDAALGDVDVEEAEDEDDEDDEEALS
jgi:hypothetical protein